MLQLPEPSHSHGPNNAGSYQVHEMFDGVRDVINQVPKTKMAKLNSPVLQGMNQSWVAEDVEVDEVRYDMNKVKEGRENEEAVEKINAKKIKTFEAISRHNVVNSRAYTVSGQDVFEKADPALFWKRFIECNESDST